ncbi:bifunctional folylpolyglutamate synthase/dihydrofolate synthase [Tundrisphaera lichenicola]|uniref:bifunctional folylpolyglutamate synthase/dihydrofolate synthase n=1 Tax=Tundrisphaera lichenicola TaxID=2029860 RepID=UPI003EBF5283
MTDDYQDSLDYLYGRLNYERLGMPRGSAELRLGRMRRLLRRLGDPHESLRIIHIAGTKGKGSTAAMLASALTASGRKTGLFCSPHLHRLEERFRVDNVEATPGELVALVEAVRPAVEALDASDPHYRHRGATFFEVTAAMGLLHFARSGAGTVVLEVGMGGRLDSTNVVRPILAVITTISFDHTRQLGNTLGAIAGEKAGILKRGRPVVSGVRGSEAREAIRQKAKLRSSPLREIDADFDYVYQPPEAPLTRPTPGRVAVRTWARQWPSLGLPMLGEHQAHNVAVALACLDALAEQGIVVEPDDVARGFSGLKWPARVEVLGEDPWVVIDGAHNVESAKALAETLRTCFPTTPRTLIFGTTREKDLWGQLQALLPLFDNVVATRYVENPRSVPPEEVADSVHSFDGRPVRQAPGPAEALALARSITPPGGLICVTGSLFLAAETRALILRRDDPMTVRPALI